MVKVKGPMMSLDASGTLAGTFTFGKWKGRNTVRSHAVPSNPRSAAQVSTRAMMRFLATAWTNLTTAEKATFQTIATTYAISPFNAYVKTAMNRWTQYEGPQIEIGSSAGTVPALGTLTLTAGVGQLSFSQVITTPNDLWGILVQMSTDTGFTPGRNFLRFGNYGTSSPIIGVVTKLVADEWFVRTAGIAEDGSLSAWLAEVSVTVT